MKKYYASAFETPVTGTKRNIYKGLSAILILFFFGCASPHLAKMKHQEEPNHRATAVSPEQKGKEVAGGSAEALADLLMRKNIISADEAERFKKQQGKKAVEERGADTASEGITALVEILKRKNVVTEDEAAVFVRQYDVPTAGEKIAASAPQRNEDEQIEEITAIVTEELKKDLQEQVKIQVKEEMAKESARDDKERIERITANVMQALSKSHPDQIKRHPTEEVPGDIAKSNREQIEKITAGISEELKKDLKEEVRTEVQKEVPKEIKKIDLAAEVPEWTKRVRFGGDIRLRYQSDRYDKNNADLAKPEAPTQLMNTKTDQDRFRYRVRVGAAVQVNEQMEAVVSLSTGNDTNPISTNSTMGDYMNRDRVYFDQAYLKWQPLTFLAFYGGRMPNPWFSSDLVWSSSLNVEGFALQVKKPIIESLIPFLTIGAFPLQQYDFSQGGKWLTGGQLGLEIKRPKGISAKIGAAYYNFRNITGVRNDPLNPGLTDWTAPLYQQKGNTLFDIGTGGVIKTALASEFKLFNITGNLDIGLWDPVHIVFLGDYVNNIGFNRFDVEQRTGASNPDEQTVGYQVGMSVGYPMVQAFGQWRVYLYYKYLGADAVVDAFTDSDFHLGGTNTKGWIFGGDLGLSKNFWLSARWLSADEIMGPPLAIDVLQVDFNTRF